MPTHRSRYVYTTLHVAAAPLYDKNIDRRPDGSLARLPRPFAPTALASCAQLKCASMPRRRDPRTCLPVERSRRRHTRMVCCASFRPPDCCLRPPINSGRASLYPAMYPTTRPDYAPSAFCKFFSAEFLDAPLFNIRSRRTSHRKYYRACLKKRMHFKEQKKKKKLE